MAKKAINFLRVILTLQAEAEGKPQPPLRYGNSLQENYEVKSIFWTDSIGHFSHTFDCEHFCTVKPLITSPPCPDQTKGLI